MTCFEKCISILHLSLANKNKSYHVIPINQEPSLYLYYKLFKDSENGIKGFTHLPMEFHQNYLINNLTSQSCTNSHSKNNQYYIDIQPITCCIFKNGELIVPTCYMISEINNELHIFFEADQYYFEITPLKEIILQFNSQDTTGSILEIMGKIFIQMSFGFPVLSQNNKILAGTDLIGNQIGKFKIYQCCIYPDGSYYGDLDSIRKLCSGNQ